MKLSTTLLLFACLLCSNVSADESSPERHAVMPAKHQAVFKKYCYDCHDSKTAEGTVDLEAIPFKISTDIEVAERWAKILNAINSGEMPPADSEPIDDGEKLRLLKDLSEQMVIARNILSDSGGVVTMRRLNRREYANTIEALLGVRPDVSNLPDDQATASGFDTQGASLFFSSDQLEQYLATAEQTLRLALRPPVTAKAKTVRVEPEEDYNHRYAVALEEMEDRVRRSAAYHAQKEKPPSAFGFLDEYQAGKQRQAEWIPLLKNYLERPETKTGATLIMTIKQGGYTRVKFPRLRGENAVGQYVIRVRVGAYPDAERRLHYLEFTSGTGSTQTRLGWRKVTASLDEPQIIEFPIEHLPGQDQQISIHQRSHQDRADKNLATLDRMENGIGTPPGLWIDWAEMMGPEPDHRPSQARSRILFNRPAGWTSTQYAKEVLKRFATDAFRGKAPDEDYLNRLVGHFENKRAKEQWVVESLIRPLSIILASPSFLYMQESIEDNSKRHLTDRELAVRLSYFLWSSPPDDELLTLANANQLSKPTVLKKQTARMLRDKRADDFVRSFVYQWLEMSRLGMFQFNGVQFRKFDNAARECAGEEIYQTVHLMLDEKLPLKTLLKADFVVINDILADYYDIPAFVGHEFRKVPVPKDSLRGGLVGSAAVLAMGSDGVRASGVERGAWILRHLLHDAPPPAPPNVPMLSRLDDKKLPARELARAHQEQPQCANCHQKIDPVGFGLENFDAAGLWRDNETIGLGKPKFGRYVKVKTIPIDPSGQLPGGKEFRDFHELRDVIASYEDEFARGLTESLIGYGLGRPYGFTDQELADSILDQSKDSGYELSEVIAALIQSEAFRSR